MDSRGTRDHSPVVLKTSGRSSLLGYRHNPGVFETEAGPLYVSSEVGCSRCSLEKTASSRNHLPLSWENTAEPGITSCQFAFQGSSKTGIKTRILAPENL